MPPDAETQIDMLKQLLADARAEITRLRELLRSTEEISEQRRVELERKTAALRQALELAEEMIGTVNALAPVTPEPGSEGWGKRIGSALSRFSALKEQAGRE